MKFTAAGDLAILRRIQPDFEGFSELAPFIRQGDARFFNLETTLHKEGECPSAQLSGGTYLRTDPGVLEDIRGFGFNMLSFNNNHTMDFSYEGLYRTLEHVSGSGYVHAGVGRNLAEASAPRYLETANGRAALISVNTSFTEDMLAGEQTPRVPGRAGINGLRTARRIELPLADIEVIRRIAEETGINVARNISRKEGYTLPLKEGEAELGELRFTAGETARVVTELNETDMRRVEKAIYEAQLQADYILISVHSHQLSGDRKENPSDFLQDFAHRCIDAGAHAVIGHGPHLLRPIEIYRERPIFYSLGDFVLQLYNVDVAPQEFFGKYGLSAASDTVHDLLKKRSRGFTAGLMEDRRMFLSVIPLWEMEDGRLKSLRLMPVECAMSGNRSRIGLPRRGDGGEIGAYLREICEPFGTEILTEEDGILTCRWESKGE